MDTEFAIIGGGVVGLSVALGLLRLGRRVVVYDEGDLAFRASRGNFGLIWVQGKGASQPAYARWSRGSAAAWKGFADRLSDATGIDLGRRQDGGFAMFTDMAELEALQQKYMRLRECLGGDYPFETLDHAALKKEEPHIGPKVAGALFHPEDGHVNPLRLLRALAEEVRRAGGEVRVNSPVAKISPLADGYQIDTATGRRFSAERIVLTAGLGSIQLGPMLGFRAPIRPQQGQILITERLPKLLNRPTDEFRQVDEGGIQIGASSDECGFEDRETLRTTAHLARHAVDVLPALARARLVRSWAALRIMSPDGLPIYQQSESHRGAYLVTCHSGITLAAAHCDLLPLWLTDAGDAPDLGAFGEGRFDVQKD